MTVFYRTYRPQRFGEVIGQEPVVSTLKNAVKKNSVSHAYLFCGSRGIGKTSIARILAKAVNCPNVKDGEPCGDCGVCEAIKNNLFIDLVEIDAASHTGVDNVRELIEHIKFKPTSARYKVFIIDEVHMLSKAAFNALLKTLEEPPEHAIFILATTDVHKVPTTIISRTQRFDFGRIGTSHIVKQLQDIAKQEKLTIEDPVFHLIARQSQGSLRDALSVLNKISSNGSKITIQEAEGLLGATSSSHSQNLAELLVEGKASEIPKYFEDLEQAGIDFGVFNRNFLEYLRGLLILKITGNISASEYLPEETTIMAEQAKQLQPEQIIYWLRLFLRSYKDLGSVPEPSLALLLASMEAAIKNPAGSASPTARRVQSEKPNLIAPANIKAEISNTTPVQPASEAEGIKEKAAEPYTIEEVRLFWPRVVERLKAVNSPLATLVKNSPVTKVNGCDIYLSVKYLFHKEHLESKKINSLVGGIINELGGKPGRLRIEISSNTPGEVPTGVDAISEVLRVFGGELVE